MPRQSKTRGGEAGSHWPVLEELIEHLPRAWAEPVSWKWPHRLPFHSGPRGIRLDLVDEEAELQVIAELPGVSRDALELAVTEDRLTIHGVCPRDESLNYELRELGDGTFQRTLVLPVAVQAQQARADLRGGLLRVRLPKRHAASRVTIPIS